LSRTHGASHASPAVKPARHRPADRLCRGRAQLPRAGELSAVED